MIEQDPAPMPTTYVAGVELFDPNAGPRPATTLAEVRYALDRLKLTTWGCDIDAEGTILVTPPAGVGWEHALEENQFWQCSNEYAVLEVEMP
jgi:hypothetical protein